MKIVILVLIAVIFIFLLITAQYRMIYHPRSYGTEPPLPSRGLIVEYNTGQGRQLAFYLPPRAAEGHVPARLWLLFGGNASLALDWLELTTGFPDPEAAFLLIDYPGYGKSRGRVNPASIMESAETALKTLAAQLETEPAALEQRLLVMGHSLGAAVALLYAEKHRVGAIVLISPFTSLKEMAARFVGPFLAGTILHDYDSRGSLMRILNHRPIPPITIIHGGRDKVVPVEMGRELANLSARIKYEEVANGDHNYILYTAREQILRAMLWSAKNRSGRQQ
jgi:pimeloyl-ACP methyl ester carboxylesterase